jgi:hypothetical protein
MNRCINSSSSLPPFTGAPHDLAGASIDRTDDAVTPVIAYGKLDPANDPMLAVVYATDYGLYRIVSTDGGVTWPDPAVDPPVHIAGTSGASINPSLAMSANYEVLVYEEQEAIKIIIDGGAAVNLSALHPEFLRNLTPSVTLAGSTAHVVWAAEVYEKIEALDDELHHHIKPVHKVLDLTQVPTKANVSNLINDVWNRRLEEAQRPVMAARDVPTEDALGYLLWSVYDISTQTVRL